MKERSDELLMIFSMIMCGCLFVNKLDGMHVKAIFAQIGKYCKYRSIYLSACPIANEIHEKKIGDFF